MKKMFVAAGILAAAFVVSVAGCKKADRTKDNSLAELRSRGKFVLGLDDSFPPLGFRDDNNNIVGYDIDLAKEVAARLGVEFVAQPIDWGAKEMELNTGKIDCIWNGFSITDERKQVLAFTEPYLNNEQALVVRKDSGIKELSGMKGKTVGLQSGSSAQDAVEGNAEFSSSIGNMVMFKDNLTAMNDLDIGGVDGIVMDSVVANYSIAQSGKPFVVVDEALSREAYGIAFRKNDVKLRDEVQRILVAMQNDGTVTAISQKWFGRDISVIGK